MKRLLVSLSVLAASGAFAAGSFAAPPISAPPANPGDWAGCQAFGEATAAGAPWKDTPDQAHISPGRIASNTLGAHQDLCD
jgi:hypothetical protein